MKNHIIYKDKNPDDTIRRCKDILKKIGIFPIISFKSKISKNLYSVSICDKNVPTFTSNGKGINSKLALASAYAELLERIQNGFRIKLFGNMPNRISFPDEQTLDYKKVFNEQENILKSLIKYPISEDFKKKFEDGILCCQFYNINKNIFQTLPLELITMTCGSNGCCAGNTPEEAIVGGLSEIAERWSQKLVIDSSFENIPTIPIELIKNLGVFDIVKELTDLNYKVIIKDCSFNNKIPVLCVILFNLEKTGYHYSFGSHPVFYTALERCLTEAFQGMKLNNMNHHLIKVQLNDGFTQKEKMRSRYLMSKNHRGKILYKFLFGEKLKEIPKIFINSSNDNKILMNYLINVFKNLNLEIYIRDVSYLNFPSYRIYIPGITEGGKLNSEFFCQSFFMKYNLFCFKKLSKKMMVKYIFELEKSQDYYPFFGENFPTELLKITTKTENEIVNRFLPIEKLFGYLFFYIKEYEKSYYYFSKLLNKNNYKNSFIFVLTVFLKLYLSKVSLNEIKSHLLNISQESIVNEIFKVFENPILILNKINLFVCINCVNCKIKKICLYNDWLIIHNKFNELVKNNPIDQTALSNLF